MPSGCRLPAIFRNNESRTSDMPRHDGWRGRREITYKWICLMFGLFSYSSFKETRIMGFESEEDSSASLMKKSALPLKPRVTQAKAPAPFKIYSVLGAFSLAVLIVLTGWVVQAAIGNLLHSQAFSGYVRSLPGGPGKVTATAASCKGSALDDPKAALTNYYDLINGDCFDEAYARQSRRIKNKLSCEKFYGMWSPNESVYMEDAEILARDSRRASLRIRLIADDPDEKGTITTTIWKGTVRLVNENGIWSYDGGDFSPEYFSQL